MKKLLIKTIIGLTVLVIICLGALYFLNQMKANAAIIEGKKSEIEKLVQQPDSIFNSYMIFNHKLTQIDDKPVRIVSKTTAQKLIKVQAIKKVDNAENTSTPISDIPNIPNGGGIFFSKDVQQLNEIELDQKNLKQFKEDIILGGTGSQDILVILDDAVYKSMNVEEISLGVGTVKWFEDVIKYSQPINHKYFKDKQGVIIRPYTIAAKSIVDIPQLYNLKEN
ncbi:lipoprotein BA_5634 family protein [Bacillus cereus group sp. MYBK234-1]|uniref:lipoprotein BA_5634 family protein n=1 Tax=unclassified Bacillus cereus group TaxID=2750818 RepID=UPI003F795604